MERLRSNYIIILHDKEIQSRRVKININERVYITYFSKRNLKIVKKSTKKFCDKFNNAKNSWRKYIYSWKIIEILLDIIYRTPFLLWIEKKGPNF